MAARSASLPPSPQRRAVLYCRVSRGETQTIDGQLQALRTWTAQRGWLVVAEHSDTVTGDPGRRKGHPPGLNAALHEVHLRKADVLVVYAADRLVRHPVPLLQLCDRVRAAGGHIASYTDGADLDTTTEFGELVTYLRGWFARMELSLNRSRTMAGLRAARASGKVLGRPRAEVPPIEVIREMQERDKMSLRAIARQLGVPASRIQRAASKTPPQNTPIAPSSQAPENE